jgi:zinc D-Ala-D-Ala dipeptidase
MRKRFLKRFSALATALFPILIFFSTASVEGSDQKGDLHPFIRKCISRNASQIRESGQLLFATNNDSSSHHVTIHLVEKNDGPWRLVLPGFAGSIGEKGFAPAGAKREGDGRSPSGIFALGAAFGYDPSVSTRMPYREATDEDYWVDDVDSEDYNKWIRGKPGGASRERMKRDDDQYKYGLVIEYNTNPVVKGMGSAIFLHVWKDGQATDGCVAMPEEKVLKVLAWLDPARKPRIIMGVEDELAGGLAFPVKVKRTENLARRAEDLVDIKEINPGIMVDMKYATEDNFTRKKLYHSNVCFLRRSTALRLNTVQRELERMDLGLKVWDCYRPVAVQKALWAVLPDERYVANPRTGSRHNRGSAVDATLVDRHGNELLMPTAFDDFTPRADRRYRDLQKEVLTNRRLLEGLMKKAGFIPLPGEWWHYDDEKWMDFDIIDLPFEKLLNR